MTIPTEFLRAQFAVAGALPRPARVGVALFFLAGLADGVLMPFFALWAQREAAAPTALIGLLLGCCAARGVKADAGRRDAIESLRVDNVALAGLPLESSHIKNLDLKNIDLTGANFSQAILDRPNFTGSDLRLTNFSGAIVNHGIFDDVEFGYSDALERSIVFTNSEVTFLSPSFKNVSFLNAQLNFHIDVTGLTFQEQEDIFDKADLTGAVLLRFSVSNNGQVHLLSEKDPILNKAKLCKTLLPSVEKQNMISRDC